MLVRVAVTLFWVAAEELCVVAAAPLRARTTTRVRIASFIKAPLGVSDKFLINKQLQMKRWGYRPWAIPQALGSSGAQTGTGSMLVRVAVTLFWVVAEEVWVVAATPVRTRTTTKARTICFIMGYP
jgi:hypothetical protein